MIVRFFRCTVHEGAQAEFRQLFLGSILPHIRAQEGLISATVGLPHGGSPTEFSMHMVWRDMDAVRGFAGETWDRAVILPEEAHLLAETHVHHYVAAEED